MGLSARAFIANPKFPTYPYPLSAAQQSQGLVAPAAAVVLLGKGGAAAVLLLVFSESLPLSCLSLSPLQAIPESRLIVSPLAVAATSAASAELIAVSSIIVYDIIGTYGKPLTGPQ